MPKVTQTPNAYVVTPTFGEALAQTLPAMIQSITTAIRRQQEEKEKRDELRFKYLQADPEIQVLLREDPEFQRALTGKRRPKPGEIPGVRDLTSVEIEERKARALELKAKESQISYQGEAVKKLQQDIALSQRKIKAWEKIDNIPVDQLTLLDFIEAGAGETPEERAQAFVAKKYPDYADKIAQKRAGEGPEIERMRVNEAAQDYLKNFGMLDKTGMQYAEAVGKNDLNAIQKIANVGVKTLAFRQYERQLAEDQAAIRRANISHQEAIGSAAQRIIEQNPTIPLTVAQDMANRLMSGKGFTPDQQKLDIDWAALKAETSLEQLRKLRADAAEGATGTTALKSMIDQHLKVIAQKEGVPEDIKKWSSEQVKTLMPELAKRVAKAVGLPPPQLEPAKDDDKWPWMPDPIVNFIVGSAGMATELSKEGTVPMPSRGPGPVPPGTPYGVAPGLIQLGQLARDAGITMSEGLTTALQAISTTPIPTRGPTGPPPKGVTAAIGGTLPAPASKELTPDQRVHLQNLALEIAKNTGDPNVSPLLQQEWGKVLDLLEAIEKGERPYTDLFSNGTFPQ